MINAKQAREIVQNYVEVNGNFHIAKIEEFITKAAEAGKYYVSYKPESILSQDIRNFVTEQVLAEGFEASWDGPKTEMVINWRKG